MSKLKVILLAAIVILAGSCGNKAPSDATESSQAAAPGVPEPPPPPKQLPPPGEPGPFLLQMSDLFPTQVFGSAATNDDFAVAFQGEVRDETKCTETQLTVCFPGAAYIAQRMNPNEPKMVKLYESDTQSGACVEDIAAVQDRFVFGVTEGVYAGDIRTSRLVVVDRSATAERVIELNPQGQLVTSLSLAPWEGTQYVACMLTQPELPGRSHIRCEMFDVSSASRKPIFDWPVSVLPRSIAAAAFKGDLLVAWTAGGRLYVAFSDAPENTMDLGPATAARPLIAAGHEQFVIAWQGDDAQTKLVRLTRTTKPSEALTLNGVDHRSLGGLVATVPGFVLAFRYGSAQQLAVIEPDLSAWYLAEGSKSWRLLSGYGALNIQDAHQGKLIWQTAESLIEPIAAQ